MEGKLGTTRKIIRHSALNKIPELNNLDEDT